jgi:hypothetical protein
MLLPVGASVTPTTASYSTGVPTALSFAVMQAEPIIHNVAIPREVYTGNGSMLFDFIANALHGFIDMHGGSSQ